MNALKVRCDTLFISTFIESNKYRGFPGGSVVNNQPANAGRCGLDPWFGKILEEETTATFQASTFLKNPWMEKPEAEHSPWGLNG